MAEQGSGWIITIAAEEGTTAWPDAPAFASTKWGLRGWTKSIHPVTAHALCGHLCLSDVVQLRYARTHSCPAACLQQVPHLLYNTFTKCCKMW